MYIYIYIYIYICIYTCVGVFMLSAQSKRKNNVVILHVSETAPPGHELSWIVNQNINFCSGIILWMSF